MALLTQEITALLPQGSPATALADVAELDDGALVTAHRRGSSDAFAELYRRYHPRLVRHLRRRVRDDAAAEDLAHETFLRALSNLGGFDATRPLWPWLRTIGTNAAIDWGRRHARRDVLSGRMEDTAPQARPDTTEHVAGAAVLTAALGRVPERQRDALTMCYLQGWRPVEAAPSFGLGRNAFEQLLHRARQNLRQAYMAEDPELGRGILPLLLPTSAIWLRRGVDQAHRLYQAGERWLTGQATELIATTAVAAAVVVGGAAVAPGPAAADLGKTEVTAAPSAAAVPSPVAVTPDEAVTEDAAVTQTPVPATAAVASTAGATLPPSPDGAAPPTVPTTRPQSLLPPDPLLHNLSAGLQTLLAAPDATDGRVQRCDDPAGAPDDPAEVEPAADGPLTLRQLLCTGIEVLGS